MGYTYIKDKTMYKAAKLAYSYMIQSKDFNTAVEYYASKFNVDENELEKQVKRMQKADGSKSKKTKRKSLDEQLKQEIAKRVVAGEDD